MLSLVLMTAVGLGQTRPTPTFGVSCSNNNSAAFFGVVTCTATLPETATGSVDFSLSGVSIPRVSVDTIGTATVMFRIMSPATPGSYTLSATYGGDVQYSSTTASVPFTITASPYPGNAGGVSGILSATCPNNNVVLYSSNFTCVASLPAGATGTVHFTISSSTLPAAEIPNVDIPIDSAGHATWNTGANHHLGSGTWQYVASYSGDSTHPAASVSWNVQILQRFIPVPLKCPNPITVGQAFSCSTLTPIGYGATTTFYMDDVPWSSQVGEHNELGGVSALYTASLSPGVHQVKVHSSGQVYLMPTDTVINVRVIDKADPTVSMSCSPQALAYGGSVTCGATISGATGAVSFKTPDGNTWSTGNSQGRGSVIHYGNHSGSVPSQNISYPFLINRPQNDLLAAVIRSGDKIVADIKYAGAAGGLIVGVGRGGAYDGANQYVKVAAPNDNTWHHYEVDLSGYAGFQVRNISITTDPNSYANADKSWDAYFAEIKIVNTDSTEKKFYSGQAQVFAQSWMTASYNPATVVVESDAPSSVTAVPLNGLNAGTYPLSVSYPGNGFWNGSSATSTVAVNQVVTATSVNCTPASPTYSQQLTCTATVSGAGAAGSVSFTSSGSSIGTIPLASGSAQVTYTPAAPGTYSIGASFAGDVNYAASSGSAAVTVDKANPNLQIVCNSPAAVTVGTTCNVQTLAGASGSVSLSIAGTQIDNGILNSAGLFTSAKILKTSPTGTYLVQVHYGGDANYTAADASVIAVVAPRVTPTFGVSCSNNNSAAFFGVVTCTATLPETATGSVDFSLSGVSIPRVSVDTIGTATVMFRIMSPATPGSYTLSATYGGDVQYSSTTASVPFTITASPYPGNAGGVSGSLSATCPNNNVVLYYSSFTCVASLPAGATGTVHFTISSSTLDPSAIPNVDVAVDSTTGKATWNTGANNKLGPGTWQYVASYSGDSTHPAASVSWNVQILQRFIPVPLKCPNPITVGQAFSCSTLTPIGYGATTTFYMDGVPWSQVGEHNELGGVSALYTASLSPGVHQVKVHSSGQVYLMPTDTVINVRIVDKADPTVSMNCNPQALAYGGSVNCGATVGGATGAVSFKTPDGNTWSTGNSQGRGSVIHYANYSGSVPFQNGSYPFLINRPQNDLLAAVIRSGDKIVADIKYAGATGGLMVGVGRGAAYDGANQYVKVAAPNDNTWHHYEVDLSGYAGFQIKNISITTDPNSYANADKSWDAYFAEIKIVNTDSTEKKFYSGQAQVFAQSWTTATYNPATVVVEPDAPSSVTALPLSGLNAGTHPLTVFYPGNGFWNSSSATSTVAVAQVASGINLSCAPAAPVYGQQLTCTANVSGAGASGTVSFTSSGSGVGSSSVASGSAHVSFTPSAAGAYTIEAVYSGDINFTGSSGSTGLIVARATPNIQINCTSPAATGTGANCDVHIASGTGSLSLMVSGTSVGSGVLNGTGHFTLPGVLSSYSAGSYQLQVHYDGDNNYLPADGFFNLTIAPPTSLTVSCNPTSVTILSPNTTCTAQLPAGTTGNVSFYVDGGVWATQPVNGSGQASYSGSLQPFGNGSHTLTVAYQGDATYPSASAALSGSLVFSAGPPPGTVLYSYRIQDTNGVSGYQANGNITDYYDSVTGPWHAEYDGLNRLIRHTALNGATLDARPYAVDQTSCWMHDPFGNITAQGITASPSCPSVGSTAPLWMTRNIVGADNRITGTYDNNGNPIGYDYDQAGNMTSAIGDGNLQSTVKYDAENRICAVVSAAGIIGYLYDAEGRRVAKGTLSSFDCNADFTLTHEYIIGPSGDEMTELDGAGQWVHTNVYAGAELSATYNNDNAGPHFQLDDWLGSKRVQVLHNGLKESVWASLPYGNMLESVGCAGCTGADANAHHFTGKQRDLESGVDYFGARYYASNMGRFMSPDWADKPEAVPYSSLDNPQSLNLYEYVKSNPLSQADPDGHCCWDKIVRWFSSSHSSSASASKSAASASNSSGSFSMSASVLTADASGTAAYGSHGVGAGGQASASVVSVSANEGSIGTSSLKAFTANAGANAGVTSDKNGTGVNVGAGANADILSAKQTVTVGPLTIELKANVGLGAEGSVSVGKGGFSTSAGVTAGLGGAVKVSVALGPATISSKTSAQGNGTGNTVKPVSAPSVTTKQCSQSGGKGCS